MKPFGMILGAGAMLMLAGCSSSLLSGKGGPADNTPIPVGNQLALPPDLSLPPPGQAQVAQRSTPAVVEDDQGGAIYGDAPATASRVAAVPKGTEGDIFEQNGISKLKPDGTKKTDWELREELRQAVIAKKKQKNPNYGTVFNAGGLFKDE